MLCYSESCLLVYDSTGTDTLYPDFPIFSVFPLGNELLIQDMDGHLYAYKGAELVPTEYAGLEDAYEIQKSIEARIVIARNAIYTLNQKNLQRLYTDIISLNGVSFWMLSKLRTTTIGFPFREKVFF